MTQRWLSLHGTSQRVFDVAALADTYARREAATIAQITKTLNYGGNKAAGYRLYPHLLAKALHRSVTQARQLASDHLVLLNSDLDAYATPARPISYVTASTALMHSFVKRDERDRFRTRL